MSNARIYRAPNRLADTVDVRFGLRLDTALARADDSVRDAEAELRVTLRAWVEEIGRACAQPEPDRARVAWLANGILGVAGMCGLTSLSRCGGLFGRAIELMGTAWRAEIGLVYASALARILDGADRAAESAVVLASLETMNQRLPGGEA